jgi:DNA-binding CsgD family transcriptional regulator
MTDRARQSSDPTQQPTPGQARDALHTLTRREREILALVATGQTSANIADQLGIKLPTVKRHLLNMYRKLGTANRVQASNLYHLGRPHGVPKTRRA